MGHALPQKYVSKYGNTFQYDARAKLDIDGVDAKCDAIVEAASTGCETICKAIGEVELGGDALCVADESLEPALEEVSDYIKSIATEGVQPTTDSIKETAAARFEELQQEEDARAEADCAAENAQWEQEQANKNSEDN